MAITQVSICNSALVKVGADRISSIDQDVRRAILLKAVWETSLKETLRSHPWNHSIKRAELAATGTAPAFEYDYAYDLPSDYIRELGITEYPEDDDVDYVIENGQILTDESTVYLKYIFFNEDYASYDAAFAEALAWKIAQNVAFAMTQSAAMVDVCEKGFRSAITNARTMDGMEGVIKGVVTDTWTKARL
jgi:hypothetical protein